MAATPLLAPYDFMAAPVNAAGAPPEPMVLLPATVYVADPPEAPGNVTVVRDAVTVAVAVVPEVTVVVVDGEATLAGKDGRTYMEGEAPATVTVVPPCAAAALLSTLDATQQVSMPLILRRASFHRVLHA
jgi:hypothetical protein